MYAVDAWQKAKKINCHAGATTLGKTTLGLHTCYMASCAICQAVAPAPSAEGVESEMCALQCPANHACHLQCLTRWCAARPNSVCTCPVCSSSIHAITSAGVTYSLQALDVNASPSKEKQLRQAALDGNLVRVAELLATPGIRVNAANWMGYTSLVRAARRGDLGMVRELLAGYLAGTAAHAAATEERYGDTAMIWAAGENMDVVRALMALRGIHVNTINATGWVAEVSIGFSKATPWSDLPYSL